MRAWAVVVAAVAACGGTAATDQSVGASEARLAIVVSGAGSVRGPGFECAAACTQRFPKGTHLTLTAAAGSSDSNFTGWSGVCSGTATCDLTLDADKSVSAAFASKPARVRLTVLIDGHGSVRSAPAAIDCGATCTATFDAGTPVALAASPEAGYRFSGWSGACTGAAVAR
jgi:hypothetical protein